MGMRYIFDRINNSDAPVTEKCHMEHACCPHKFELLKLKREIAQYESIDQKYIELLSVKNDRLKSLKEDLECTNQEAFEAYEARNQARDSAARDQFTIHELLKVIERLSPDEYAVIKSDPKILRHGIEFMYVRPDESITDDKVPVDC